MTEDTFDNFFNFVLACRLWNDYVPPRWYLCIRHSGVITNAIL